MLDADTKRRIDSCRDILVGKVPDPKSQVEQITIALIYKFMDDMDAQSEALGGKRAFFTGSFEQYGWAKLMAPNMGGYDILAAYSEAIQKINQNPNIPALFRDIFKNAYLPYRDPETLRLFLKEINGFSYDHSKRLGDAFEYLLSVLGSQGDAGQFRTPRNIIDFMVEIMEPQKNDVILDMACGTAGFLISAYKHILKHNSSSYQAGKDQEAYDDQGVPMEMVTLDSPLHYSGDLLSPDDRKRIHANIKGYDISPDMVRLSLVNMYLHGFPNPHVIEYDTLTSEDRWNEYADLILANPPFMTPKGGIKPHNRFTVKATKSEVLFVDYIAEHLTPWGRAAVIVPEGIIFQSGKAYKQLRKLLVDSSLVAVISLPAGVFNPYSGVKTSILILDKRLNKMTDSILFAKIENDGFGLGAQRRPIDKNDLPAAARNIKAWMQSVRAEAVFDLEGIPNLHVVEKSRIAENGEYGLSGERYLASTVVSTDYPMVAVGSLMKEGVKTIDPLGCPDEVFELWSIPAFDSGKPELQQGRDIGSQKKVIEPNDVLLSRIVPHIRRGWVVKPSVLHRQIGSTEWIVFRSDDVDPEFLRRIVISDHFHKQAMQTITGVGGSLSRINPKALAEILIPHPPLETQQQIVAEIEEYQKVIDGARQVVENYKPRIQVDPEWPVVRLADVCDRITDGDHQPPPKATSGVPFITISNIDPKFGIDFSSTYYVPEEYYADLKDDKKPRKGDVLYTVTGSYGISLLVDSDRRFCFQRHIALLRPSSLVDSAFLCYFLQSNRALQQAHELATGVAQKTVSLGSLRGFMMPLPPLEVQQAIVQNIERERQLVNANNEIVALFEAKIKSVVDKVWGDDGQANQGEQPVCR